MHQEQQEVQFSRSDANQLIPSVESAYYGLIMKGKYLPRMTSSIITSEYLLNVLFAKTYAPEVKDIKIGFLLRPIKKDQILEELEQIPLPDGVQWGFDTKHQPEKQWAINVLFTLKSNHPFFKKYSPEKYDLKSFTQEQLSKIKTLDLTQGKRSAVRRFFRVPKEKQYEIQEQKKVARKTNLEKKMLRKQKLVEEMGKEIEELDQQVKDIE